MNSFVSNRAQPEQSAPDDVVSHEHRGLDPGAVSVNHGEMGLIETHSHRFIIRIWLEETAEEADREQWRGHITHVPSGTCRHFQELKGITTFVASYLAGAGVKRSRWWRLRHWLGRKGLGSGANGRILNEARRISETTKPD